MTLDVTNVAKWLFLGPFFKNGPPCLVYAQVALRQVKHIGMIPQGRPSWFGLEALHAKENIQQCYQDLFQ